MFFFFQIFFVNVEVGVSLRMSNGTSDRAEKHDLGCLVSYAFSNFANTKAAQKLITVEVSDIRDKSSEMPEHGSEAVSWSVEELAKAGSALANSSVWKDLRLLLPA